MVKAATTAAVFMLLSRSATVVLHNCGRWSTLDEDEAIELGEDGTYMEDDVEWLRVL
jgi:hypothetical protein